MPWSEAAENNTNNLIDSWTVPRERRPVGRRSTPRTAAVYPFAYHRIRLGAAYSASAAAPRTMILLDPDLDPNPANAVARPGRPVASKRRVSSREVSSLTRPVPSIPTLARFLSTAQEAVRLRGRVSVLLTTDRAIRRLNRQFRGIDKATDVLSFPAEAIVPRSERIAGDLAISVPTARRQSAVCGHSLGTELKVLMLHGLLHLAGYDHEVDSGKMARRERALRTKLGLPHGLIERVQTKSVRRTARHRT